MRWFAQVWHVAAKDVRQARWVLLAYLGVVALATAGAFRWPGASRGIFEISMFLVVITGIFVAAFLVQADSPTRSDAFWASRPFHPTAVLMAKAALTLLIVIGVPLVAQVTVLKVNDLPGSMLVRLGGRSVWVYSLWLLMAMVVAAVSRDLRTFTTTLVIIPVGMGLVTIAFSGVGTGSLMSSTTEALLSVLAGLVGIGVAVVLLLRIYLTRTLRRRTWVAAVIVVACLFVTIFVSPSTPVSAIEPLNPPATDFGVVIEVADSVRSGVLLINVDGVRPSKRLLVLEAGTVVLRLRDATTVRVPLRGRLTFEAPALPIGNGIRWVGPPPFPMDGGGTPLDLTSPQREALRAGIASATLEGWVTTVEPRLESTLPFRAGASRRHDGRSVRILSTNFAGGDSLAALSYSSIGPAESSSWVGIMPPWELPRYVLVNKSRREAALPGPGLSGASSEALVLPGAWRWGGTILLRRGTMRDESLPVDAGWLNGADLAVVDWSTQRRTHMRTSATVR